MNDKSFFFTPRQAQRFLGCSYSTLRRSVKDGRIDSFVLPSGHRLFKLSDTFKTEQVVQNQKICYCRVSTKKQTQDLNNQIKFCSERFPDYQIVSDIGSGLNWNRKGLKTILDRVFQGLVSEIVVAHKDRIEPFAFELFQYILEKHNVKLLVLDQNISDQLTEFSNDIISIITSFSAKYYGKRKYKSPTLKKNKIVLKLIPKTNN